MHGLSPQSQPALGQSLSLHSLHAMPTGLALHGGEGSHQGSAGPYVYYFTPPPEGDPYFSAPGFDCFGQRDIGRHDVSGSLSVITRVGLALEILG